jgi:menaquinone-dependent protoporphyrinogen oxidase
LGSFEEWASGIGGLKVGDAAPDAWGIIRTPWDFSRSSSREWRRGHDVSLREGCMCNVPVFYATTEGQTRRIADRMAERIRDHGLDARAIAIDSREARDFSWALVRGVGLGASLHVQKHQASAVAFAREHAHELNARPSLFFSVSLAAASKNPVEVAAAQRLADAFAAKTGWQPQHTASVAGRLAYSQYGRVVRFFMRRIALKEGASGDTSRDHEYTDWAQVIGLADTLVGDIRSAERQLVPASA